jgi:SAM-dependent methyltransferase
MVGIIPPFTPITVTDPALNTGRPPQPWPSARVYSHRANKIRATEVPVSLPEPEIRSYDDFYGEFDSPLMQRLRQEAYGKDIGQHSWVTAEELEDDIARLQLALASRLLDLGCGPCGPLTFVASRVRCRSTGMDVSANAIAAGKTRAAALAVAELVTLFEADLNQPIRFDNGSFDAVMSLDVVLHLRHRAEVFREVVRVLEPGGRFLFTDAGVITGSVSDDEIRRRAIHGYTQFAPPGFNEKVLERVGLRLLDRIDRTPSLLKNAAGRLAARTAQRGELEQLEGKARFEREQQYLETVIGLSQRGALARMMYLAEAPA